jgi:hypothetical protein
MVRVFHILNIEGRDTGTWVGLQGVVFWKLTDMLEKEKEKLPEWHRKLC